MVATRSDSQVNNNEQLNKHFGPISAPHFSSILQICPVASSIATGAVVKGLAPAALRQHLGLTASHEGLWQQQHVDTAHHRQIAATSPQCCLGCRNKVATKDNNFSWSSQSLRGTQTTDLQQIPASNSRNPQYFVWY